MDISLLASYTITLLSISILVALAFEAIFFLLSLRQGRNDIVDVSWGIGFIVIVFFWLALVQVPSWSFILAVLLVTVWGIRLSYHIWTRYMSKEDEDRRYVEMKKNWKWKKTRSFFHVFVLQGVLMSFIILPVVLHANSGVTTHWFFVLVGTCLWALGFYFQVMGDFQLQRFLTSPKRTGMMKTGLWSKTRHPNYFGEIAMWWGIFFITLTSLHPAYLLVAAIGPVMITLLLRYVSGVPMLEKHWQKKYGNEFIEYEKTTPMLVPHFFKSKDEL